MEFLIYLSPIGNQIIQDLVSAKFKVMENYGYCSDKNIYGYSEQNRNFVICTDNIKRATNDVYNEVNITVYHEAVHSAQTCKGYNTLGIPKHKMNLSWKQKNDLNDSLKAFDNSVNSKYYGMEYEAYWLEDKPKEVDFYIKKFCLNK